MRFRALVHIFFKSLIWVLNECSESQISPKNECSFSYLIKVFPNFSSGSEHLLTWRPIQLQKWITTVLLGDTVNPFSVVQYSILLMLF